MGRYYDTATNGEASVTIPALKSGRAQAITQVLTSYGDAPTGGRVTIESPAGIVVSSYAVTAAGAAPVSFEPKPFEGADGQAIVVKLADGGSGVVGDLTVITRD